MRLGFTPLLALGLACAGPLACASDAAPSSSSSSGGGTTDAGSIDSEDIDLAVYPLRQYSGFDGTHDFQIPVSVFRAKDDLTLEASDPDAVEITAATYEDAKEDGSYFLVKAKRAGDLTLTARSRGKSVTTTLSITAYDAASYALGEQRYTHDDETTGQPACSSCHQQPGGPDHSPAAISAASDEQVQAVVRTGIDLSNSPITRVDHRWKVEGKTLDGLVTYLRALPPRGYDPQQQSLRSWRGAVPARGALEDFTRAWLRPRLTADLALVRERRDALGMTHVRFAQTERGVPVLGAEVTAHYTRSGTLRSVASTAKLGLAALDLTPRLDAADAERIVQTAFTARWGKHPTRLGFEPMGEAVGTHLGIHARGGDRRLVYAVGISSDDGVPIRGRARVDAHTGELVELYDDVKTVAASSKGVFGEDRAIQISGEDPEFTLKDATRGNGILTYTAGEVQELPGTLLTSTDAQTWDHDVPNGKGAAVDAHFFAGAVYDFYALKFSRKGIDGKDGAITSSVHYGIKYDNAFWEGHQMAYGDGDLFGPFAGAPDVVAHELTHGVTQSESQLEYLFQAGAINEAISDIFGALVEHELLPDPDANWTIGEKIERTPGKPLRNMVSPAEAEMPQPDHMEEYLDLTKDQDNGGVHLNSGIVNQAAYLMTMGGTHRLSKVTVPGGIGWDKLAQLWYRVNTEYLQRQSEFVDAAAATASAAEDLGFGEAEQRTIACAWQAVGVTDTGCSDAAEPVAGEPDAGTTSTSSSGELARGNNTNADFDKQASACNAQPGSSAGGLGLFALLGLLATRRRRTA